MFNVLVMLVNQSYCKVLPKNLNFMWKKITTLRGNSQNFTRKKTKH